MSGLPAEPRLRELAPIRRDISQRTEVSSRKTAVVAETALKFKVEITAV